MTDQIWRRRDNWVGSQVEDSFVMLNIEGGEYIALNVTATDIWNILEVPATALQVAETLTERYSVSADQCIGSVSNMLRLLAEKGLVHTTH